MSLHLDKLMGPEIRSEEQLELARLAELEIAPRTRSQMRNRLLRAGADHWHWMRRGDFVVCRFRLGILHVYKRIIRRHCSIFIYSDYFSKMIIQSLSFFTMIKPIPTSK